MTRRFDEIELYPDSFPVDILTHPAEIVPSPATTEIQAAVPLWKRAITFITDATLFLALGLALTPLLPFPASQHWPAWASMTGFILLISFFYFVGSWLVWGKTLGGALFDVKIVGENGDPASLHEAAGRWVAIFVSIATCGIGFALAVLPSRHSLSDRLSGTRAIPG